MPILKSAKKRLRTTERQRVTNDRRRRTMREGIKAFKKLIVAKDTKGAQALLPQLYKAIDKAVKAGVIKKNTAARKKSGLVKTIQKGQ